MRTTIGLLVALTVGPLGCQERPPPPPPQEAPAPAQSQEACVDQWLAARKLDAYGNAEGTMYAGGTPLFDERTGQTRDRLEYVYSRHPEAKAACGSAGR